MTWTWSELQAVGRHAANTAASITVGAVAMSLLSQTDGATITDGIQNIVSGVEQIVKGVTLIAGALVPIYTAWQARRRASPKAQTDAVVQTLQNPVASRTLLETADRNKLISAVGDMPEVKQLIATPEVAQSTASSKVVAGAA